MLQHDDERPRLGEAADDFCDNPAESADGADSANSADSQESGIARVTADASSLPDSAIERARGGARGIAAADPLAGSAAGNIGYFAGYGRPTADAESLRQRLWRRCRLVVQSRALRRAFCPRHLGAAASSLGLHLSVVLAVVLMTMPLVRRSAAPTEVVRRLPTLAIFAPTSPPPAPGSDRPNSKRMVNPKEAGPVDIGIRMGSDSSTLAFNGFTFDVAKLTSRAGALFPFLTRRFSFDLAAKRAPRTAARLVSPYAPTRMETRGSPLFLTDAELQLIVDRTWSRRERWTPFQPIRTMAESYSPDDGQLPKLLRGYATQNVLQPYVETKMRDPRIWSQLALAADHSLFLDFIDDYASRHPGTKATIELLFLLDMLAEASLDTLVVLLEVEPGRDLQWTRTTNPAAFAALRKIQDHYAAQRRQRGLETHKALNRHYEQIRLGILESIVRTAPDGYRSGDAHYLMGEIYWRQARYAEARKAWRAIDADPKDRYVETYSKILNEVRAADAADARERAAAPEAQAPSAIRQALAERDKPSLEPALVHTLLGDERDRWLRFSRARLLQFGYRLDSY